MGEGRHPRIVVNPGWACTTHAASGELLGNFRVLDVSRSGIALVPEADASPALDEGRFYQLSISHEKRAPALQLGSERPLRAQARRSRLQKEGHARVCFSFVEPLSAQDLGHIRQADHEVYPSEAARFGDPCFLVQLARAGDFPADALVAGLDAAAMRELNDALDRIAPELGELPSKLPETLRSYLDETHVLPWWINREGVERGRQVFLDNAIPVGVVLFLKVLPTGYCAPALARALTVSGDSVERPVRRSLLVLQMLIDFSDHDAWRTLRGGAVLKAQKLRAFHAAVRPIVTRQDAGYESAFGRPINQEQMLATIMGFSYETLQGLRALGVGLSAREEQDFLCFWQAVATLMGIHPEGDADSSRHVPQTLEAAAAFQGAFRARHYKSADENPDGAELTRALLQDLGERYARGLPLPFVKHVPRWLTHYFLSQEDLARLRMRRTWRSLPPIAAILCAFWVWKRVFRVLDRLPGGRERHHRLALALLREIVDGEFQRPPRVRIPATKRTLRTLVQLEFDEAASATGAILELTAEPFATPQQVLERLGELESLLRSRGDRRAIFATAYAGATGAILRQAEASGFADDQWVMRYLLAFANLYRKALHDFERGELRHVPRAWRRSFDVSRRGVALAMQDLLLGINAHINHDLPLALAEIGIDPDRAARLRDHTAVNRALQHQTEAIQNRINKLYAPGMRIFDFVLGRLDEAATNIGFQQLREGAWQSAVRLVDARDPRERQAAREAIEQRSVRFSQLIAVNTAEDDLRIGLLRSIERWRFWDVL